MDIITKSILALKSKGLLHNQFVIDIPLLHEYRKAYCSVKGTSLTTNKKHILQGDRISALNLLRYKKENNIPITEGMVYIISNPAWPNLYKIGMTVDVEKRLASYQTYSPYRDYKLEHYQFYTDRRQTEKLIHSYLETKVKGEWFEILDLLEFKQLLKNIKYKEYNALID